MGLLRKIQTLPAFLLGVFFLYWSLPLAALMNKVKFLKLAGKRNDAYGWGVALQQLFGVTMLRLPGPQLANPGGPIIFLSNHRSWADFYLDVVATEGNAQMLSRMAVALVFPMFMGAVCVIRSVILFQRGRNHEKEAFNKMIDRKMAASPVDGLIVYPEGHRSTLRHSLPLKRGMLNYAYIRKIPVQIVMSANKEAVISEKELSCKFGQEVLVGYSEAMHPSSYPTFDGFVAAVQKEWDIQWSRVYSADWSTATTITVDETNNREYPWSIKLAQVFVTGGIVLFFFAVLYWSSLAWAAFLTLFGRYQALVSAVLSVWASVSLLMAFRRVRLPLKTATTSSGPSNSITNGVK
ncbi:hypothetical protein WJX75_004155 [Coccomyxa subellipsoidea]|uniref:Phospholipid/glycerol acyltransferase domain-containing protein n=1 Tax=Coccomyxa subellipsoidea TaxID=248742 RepID=A0ABR2YE01_9CHLO